MSKIQISNKNYSFIWIPSHFKIYGNEKGSSVIYEHLPPNSKYQPADFKSIVNEYVYGKWNIEGTNEQTNKLKNLISYIPEKYKNIELNF